MKKSAMVIDIGSSTTDFAYIVDGHQQNVSLFGDTNLGGGLIDELILSRAMAASRDQKALEAVFEESPAWRSYCELEARRLKESYFLDEEKWAEAPLCRTLTVCYDEPLALELSIGGASIRKMVEQPIPGAGRQKLCRMPERRALRGGGSQPKLSAGGCDPDGRRVAHGVFSAGLPRGVCRCAGRALPRTGMLYCARSGLCRARG